MFLFLPPLVLFVRDWSTGRRLRRILRRSTLVPEFAENLFREIRGNAPYAVRLRASEEIAAPIVFGFFRPTLLLPTRLVETSRTELRACLAHECSHLKNGDLWTWNVVRRFQYILWIQPFYWMLCGRLLVDQDYLADEDGVRACSEPADYAQILFELAKTHTNVEPWIALGMAAPPTQLRRRIEMLLNRPYSLSRTMNLRKLLLPLLLLSVLTFLGGTLRVQFIAAQEPEKERSEIPGLVVERNDPKEEPVRGAREDASSPALSNGEITDLLEVPFSCDFKEPLPLFEALLHISETIQVPFVIDGEMEIQGLVSTESPVVQFQPAFQLSLRDLLDYLTRPHGIRWHVEDGVILFDATGKRRERHYTRSYFVGDLLRETRVPLPEGGNPLDAITDPGAAQGIQFQVENDFEPIIDYIKKMVGPESWTNGGDVTGYYPNLSLIIRQSEAGHMLIAELLTRLRKVNDTQIAFDYEILSSAMDYKGHGRMICFNGQEGQITGNWEKDNIVRIVPASSKLVPEKFAATNKPFILNLPEGTKTIAVKGIAGRKNGRDIIKTTVTVQGREPETRTFYASPLLQEDLERLLIEGIDPAREAVKPSMSQEQREPPASIAFSTVAPVGADP